MGILIQTKPNNGTEGGRLIVYKGRKVIMSKHYRNLKHRDLIIVDITKLTK